MRAVNLIPAEQRTRGGVGAGRSGGGAYAVVGLVAGLALMAFLYGLAAHQISDRQSEVASKQARTQRLQQQASALAAYTSFVQMRQQRVAAVESLVDSRFDWAHVMHEFGRVLPNGVEISSLAGSVGTSTPAGTAKAASAGGAVASATPPGTVPTFVIAGCTATQAKVAEMLTRLRLIDGVTEVTLQSSTKSQSVSGAGAGAAGGNGCPPNAANFTATVTFQPLPAATAAAVAGAAHATTISTGAKG